MWVRAVSEVQEMVQGRRGDVLVVGLGGVVVGREWEVVGREGDGGGGEGGILLMSLRLLLSRATCFFAGRVGRGEVDGEATRT